MPPARKRSIRDKEHAKLKEAYGTDCARLYFGILCIVSLLAAVTVANDAAIKFVLGPPPAPPPPPPPPPPPARHGVAAFFDALMQWLR